MTRTIVLDFTELEYMNSTGIGLLVTLLVRAQRHRQRILEFGLSEHYRQMLSLARLDEAIGIVSSEDEALATA
jgi:anti-sigma B factor antagonist